MEIKCIHTGDIHLGMEFKNASFDYEYAKNRRMELWKTFEKIIDRCSEYKTDILIIAGDLFEENYCNIGDIKRILDKFKEAKGTRIVIATGNHDPLTERSLYKLVTWPKNVYIFESQQINKIEFEELNTVLWGISWNKKEEKQNLLSNLKIDNKERINILVAHGDILNKQSEYMPIDKSWLNSLGFDYIALGHIHKHQFVNDRICYCGSPEPLDFSETGLHGIVEGTISKSRVNMNFIPFSKRVFKVNRITIEPEFSYQEIISKIIECDEEGSRKKNLFRIILEGIRDQYLNFSLDEIKDKIKDEFYYVELIDNTELDYDLQRIKEENKNNIIGYFIEEMEKKDFSNPVVKDALYLGLKALLKEKMER